MVDKQQEIVLTGFLQSSCHSKCTGDIFYTSQYHFVIGCAFFLAMFVGFVSECNNMHITHIRFSVHVASLPHECDMIIVSLFSCPLQVGGLSQ